MKGPAEKAMTSTAHSAARTEHAIQAISSSSTSLELTMAKASTSLKKTSLGPKTS